MTSLTSAAPIGATAWQEGRTENISRSGVLFLADHAMEVDTRIEMTFVLPATLRGICSGQPIKQAYPRDFDDLRGAYLSELPEKTDAMAALAAALVAGGWHKPTVESLMHMAHRLAGSSALYGVDGFARAAGILAAMLKRLLEAPRWPPSRPPHEVATLVKALARCVPGRARRAPRARQARVDS